MKRGRQKNTEKRTALREKTVKNVECEKGGARKKLTQSQRDVS